MIAEGILSKILKRVLNQRRPPELETATLDLKPSDGGMPSSHAMSLGFIGTFTGLTLPSVVIWLLLYVALSLVYRVQVNLHTWEQIAVGLLVGTFNGAIWWHLCNGQNPWDINIMDLVSEHLLDETGVLPWPMLVVPAFVGLVVVGSFERRISRWIRNKEE